MSLKTCEVIIKTCFLVLLNWSSKPHARDMESMLVTLYIQWADELLSHLQSILNAQPDGTTTLSFGLTKPRNNLNIGLTVTPRKLMFYFMLHTVVTIRLQGALQENYFPRLKYSVTNVNNVRHKNNNETELEDFKESDIKPNTCTECTCWIQQLFRPKWSFSSCCTRKRQFCIALLSSSIRLRKSLTI